jgi:alpha-ketoglutarate-dependent taurine dioxygenase
MSFKTRPLSDALGVEVMGVDPSRDIDEAGIAELRRLWLKHCILLFRGVDWTPARQVAFTRRFGALHIMPGLASEHSTNHPDHPEVMVVSNIKRAGKPIGLKRAGWGWHSDGEDKMLPNMGSLLHALKLPPDTGDTAFANSYKAYDSLPKATRDRIDGRRGRFSRTEMHAINYPEMPALTDRERRDRPDVWHPITRTHPETGRTALYVGRWTVEIEGIARDEGKALLRDLIAHAVQPEFVYTHRWTVGDAILWDNRCVQHRAMPFDDDKYERHMHRTTLEGDIPYFVSAAGERIESAAA